MQAGITEYGRRLCVGSVSVLLPVGEAERVAFLVQLAATCLDWTDWSLQDPDGSPVQPYELLKSVEGGGDG